VAENQTDEKAWKASFTEGGTTYAASLFWQPLLDDDKPLPEIKEAKKIFWKVRIYTSHVRENLLSLVWPRLRKDLRAECHPQPCL